MRQLLPAIISAVVFLSACGTTPYTPTEYALRDGLITGMPVSGAVKVINGQSASGQVIVYSYAGSQMASDLRSITDVMVRQTEKELSKAGQVTAGPGKTVELKVNSLLSTYAFFYWNSSLNFEAKLGNGEVVTRTVPHTSGILLQNLNGCIAESVMTLLNDQKVRAYLAQ